MLLYGLQEARRHVRIVFGAVDEGLDIAFDHRQRCAQFVADVRDKFLACVFQLFEPRQIVKNENHSLPVAVSVEQRRCVHLQTAVVEARRLQFKPEDLAFGPNAIHQLLKLMQPQRFHHRTTAQVA